MRLLQHRENGDISLTEHIGEPPPYAILSHTWGADNEEVTFRDLVDGTGTEKEGYRKLRFCGQQAARHGLEHYWIDTCCIDKASSAELSEAINSMFRWYRNSVRCYVYMADVSTSVDDSMTRWKPDFKKSKWFTRGWTLQELIAPTKVEFFSQEGELLGDKLSLQQTLHEITGIALDALKGGPLGNFSIEERLLWAAKRTTKREEDAAYSLFGIFDVHMSLIYGEGREKATKRLLREIQEHWKLPIIKGVSSYQSREEQLRTVQQWLSAADPSSNYQQALSKRQENTGLWLTESEQYQKWKTSSVSFLWLYGIPGSGKTILSSTILRDIFSSHGSKPSTIVVYFYFDFNDAQKQSTDSMLKSLVYQLLQRVKDIPSRLDSLYPPHGSGRQQPTSEALLNTIRESIQKFEQAYIVLDALDECSQRVELMHALATISNWRLENSHFVVTSRRERDIESGLAVFGVLGNSVCLSSSVVDEDIRHYVRQRLSDDLGLKKWSQDPNLREQIETALVEGSQGMFRWAVCQLDTLRKCRNRAGLRRSLATLPQTLEQTYDRILHKITQEDSIYAIRVLRWLTFAERPLSLHEIAEAVALVVGRTPVFDKEEVLQDPMEILDICSSLVTVRDMRDGEDGWPAQIVVLAHFSVKEHLLSHKLQASDLNRYAMHHQACHSMLARSCLEYLLQVLRFDLDSRHRERTKLLSYCSEHWTDHAEEAGGWDPETAKTAVRLLSMTGSAYEKWLQLYSPDRPWNFYLLSKSVSNTALPLYYAALFGVADVIVLLLESGADVNAEGGEYGTALHAAAICGHERTVELLIAHGAHINTSTPHHGSAIQAASEVGHEWVVKRLIEAGAEINARGGINGSALDLAIGNNHNDVVALLLKNGAELETLNRDGVSPLTGAACIGHNGIIKLLLSHGATISATDSKGWTAINSASIRGHSETVKLLIDNGADLNIANRDAWTPVYSASFQGNYEVVRLLLSAGADISLPNDDGWTPLPAAVDGNHYNVVKVLLEHDMRDAYIKAQSKDGHSALSRAAEKGFATIVELLLANGASAVQEDFHGSQAISYAAVVGSLAVLKLLLDVSQVGPNHTDRYGRSALWWAASCDRPKTVKFLLHEIHCDPKIADACGRTPLMIAARRGYQDIVDVLQIYDGNVVDKNADLETATIRSSGSTALMCDICEYSIADADFHYHCFTCARGDWDICAECKGHGMTCLDHTHTLTKRTIQNDRLVELI
ncbi:hypothetical protein HBI24_193910 [Parastagonospora nodorum]|nr:hypothetical protein HBI24_193910 [Parastagonospora nodorum]